MYRLRKYSGAGSKETCPNCGRKRCFSPYVNEDGKGLAPNVGRCDHESKCGYHYSPKDFFRDHPSLNIPESWMQQAPKEVSHEIWTIKRDEVDRFRSNESTLGSYLRKAIGGMFLAAAEAYKLGALIDGSTIFWQIDIDGRVRTGKVMAYGGDGHRIKNSDCDRVTWMHRLLMKDGLLPDNFELTQCLFGEHMLRVFPDKAVAIVESEKTAIIMASLAGDMVWLATGGKNNLNSDRLAPLRGRKVYIYPDADAVQEWKDKVALMNKIYDIVVCDLHYTDDDILHKRDIADLVIEKLNNNKCK